MGRIWLCVPEVVVLELVANVERKLREAEEAVERGRSSLQKLTRGHLAPPGVGDGAVAEAVNRYNAWLRKLIAEHGEVLPMPAVTHETLVSAVLSTRKPFSSGEKGYRDALIWHSTLELAAHGPVTLVTANTKDFFGAAETALADDLVADVRSAGLEPSIVRPLTTFEILLNEVLPQDVGGLEDFVAFASSSEGRQQLGALVDDFFEREQRVHLVAADGTLPDQLFDEDIEGLHSAIELTTAAARPLGDEWFLITGRTEALAYVGGIVWQRDPLPDQWHVWDTLGGQEYIAFPVPQRVSVEFSVKFQPPEALEDLHIDRAILLDTELRQPDLRSSAPPRGGALEQARWLRGQIDRLLGFNGTDYHWAVRDEWLIENVAAVLDELSPAVGRHSPPTDYGVLDRENLATTLEEGAGALRLRQALDVLIEALSLDG